MPFISRGGFGNGPSNPYRSVTILVVQPPEVSKRKWPDPKNGPWTLEAWYLPVRGRWELVGLRIEPPYLNPDYEPTALTTTLLRALVPSRLAADHRLETRQSLQALSMIIDRQDPDELARFGIPPAWLPAGLGLPSKEIRDAFLRMGSAGDSDEPRRPGRPARWGSEQLAEVARIYDEAWHRGDDPTKAVADRVHISRSLAAKQVMRCRKNRLLPETKAGRPTGNKEPKQP